MREWTVRAFLLGAGLSMVLAAANAYLGLRVGMTVSASIPAAVASMAVLKAFRGAGMLENNLVQTAASAGEALAAGVIFTLPALVLLGHWDGFPYGQVTWIALLGGLIGVVFSVPLRRALLAHPDLRFPEGVATAEVLKSGHGPSGGAGALVVGGLFAALVKLAQTGVGIVGETIRGGVRLGGGAVAGWGADLSLSLVAVGYIVGLRAAGWMCAGGALAWLVAIPLYGWWVGAGLEPGASARYDAAFMLWRDKVRFLGVGAMVVGGLWSVLSLAPALAASLRVWGRRAGLVGSEATFPAGERDTPTPVLMAMLAALVVGLVIVYRGLVGGAGLGLPEDVRIYVMSLAILLALAGGFLFSAVAGYMAGLVGSSHNPVSGVTIATVLITSLLLLPALGGGETGAAAAAAIVVGAVVCCAAAISGDNLQDLKAGRLLGATPWRQQAMQIVGVVAGAVVMAPVLDLLYQAYGIGPALPRPDMDPAAALAAPQATLMQSLAQGVFAGRLEWGMLLLGGLGAALLIGLHHVLAVRRPGAGRMRPPVLAVAVGLYLPIELTVPIFFGGLLAAGGTMPAGGGQRALLFASGLIAGEALAGVALALAFALARRTDILQWAPPGVQMLSQALGLGCVAAAAFVLLRFRRQGRPHAP